MKSGIYRIINTINNCIYVGSAINLTARKNKHFTQLFKNSHYNKYLQNAFNLYKREAFIFDVLEYCKKEELIKREQFWIDAYKMQGVILYNICSVAGNTYGRFHSEETRKKMAVAQRGKVVTEEARRKSSETQKGRLIKEEVRRKMSEAHKGKHHTEETKQKIADANSGKLSHFKGKIRPNKTREKMSIAKKEWWAKKKQKKI